MMMPTANAVVDGAAAETAAEGGRRGEVDEDGAPPDVEEHGPVCLIGWAGERFMLYATCNSKD